MPEIIKNIKKLFEQKNRKYLNIFKLERDTSLTDIMIKAMDKGIIIFSNF